MQKSTLHWSMIQSTKLQNSIVNVFACVISFQFVVRGDGWKLLGRMVYNTHIFPYHHLLIFKAHHCFQMASMFAQADRLRKNELRLIHLTTTILLLFSGHRPNPSSSQKFLLRSPTFSPYYRASCYHFQTSMNIFSSLHLLKGDIFKFSIWNMAALLLETGFLCSFLTQNMSLLCGRK